MVQNMSGNSMYTVISNQIKCACVQIQEIVRNMHMPYTELRNTYTVNTKILISLEVSLTV